jgi:RNA polymerase sigma factor (TIGR02999 family)
MQPDQPITRLLRAWRDGDESALSSLMPIVYDQLRSLAERYFRSENSGNTLSPTVVVHETYLRLIDAEIPWQDRAHLFAVAARMMRRILVDHAREQKRLKRGGGLRITLTDAISPQKEPRILDLDDSLTRLSSLDARKGDVIELIFFGGLTYAETAAVLSTSEATVHRDLTLAKAWLFDDMKAAG